jgi:putative addiction module killer protein
MFQLHVYETEDGKRPFSDWLKSIRDTRTRVRLTKRLEKVERGVLGDFKPLEGANGIYELREHYGPGYRIYYSRKSGRVILLLAGSDKDDQDRTIDKAKQYLADYERRNPE